MEIVVHVPTSPALSALGFEFDSAFPGVSLVACLPELVVRAQQNPSARLMVFGHADEAGSEHHNKLLSERRADVILALITQDLSIFDRVAHEDRWGLVQYQAIMEGLGIRPMKADGKPGPQTSRGVRNFARAYEADLYHVRSERGRAYPPVDGAHSMSPAVEAALRDAYVAQVHVKLDPDRFMGPKTAGCSEFNRIGSAEHDRRVVLALYRPGFPTESRIPCTKGDAAACKLNRKAKHPLKCNFYRRTLEPEVVTPPRARPLAGDALFDVPPQRASLPRQASLAALALRDEPLLLASADPDFVPARTKPKVVMQQVADVARASQQAGRAKASDADQHVRTKSEALRNQGREQHEKRDKDDTASNLENTRFIAFTEVQLLGHPALAHDHGFLQGHGGKKDLSKRQEPTEADGDSLYKWEVKARLAQALRPDLWDAVKAYLHFLHGEGADLTVDYEDFIEDDRAGTRVLQSAIEDVRFAAFEMHRELGGGQRNFLMQSDIVSVGEMDETGVPLNDRYPYPGTENWQKAIGAHPIWIDTEVAVTEEARLLQFQVIVTLHVEDMYNFNPGMQDMATGIPDAENGRFEIVGYGHEFLSKGNLRRLLRFSVSSEGVSVGGVDEQIQVTKP